MAVVAPQGYVLGGAGPLAPLQVPLGATGVNSANPNNFPVYVKVTGGTVSNITVNGVSQTPTSGTFLLNAGANLNITYSVAPTVATYSTGLTPANSYPFTDPVFQTFTVQQYLQVPGVNPSGTYD